ncbi:hypothetical protein DICPUDRAFT_83893 [Dictyostelium purpureum]|uniref:Uncharacterized protein n=1 Tax=Dictyostelium purpureum TaxID=5786 RepID=F1A0Y4_DICPU|nr:uncharacterized protein DICPUDRAFT_83893 [Dictyostelium purpureum]EGC30149.1 hypothetical protein DICPUDRAFT_83893 [Dictyostelium purpureum]|eukprot:XP_003293332.1 hypothetical protein DICPUDRAFT_83893 [Dictyostelium purpureum]
MDKITKKTLKKFIQDQNLSQNAPYSISSESYKFLNDFGNNYIDTIIKLSIAIGIKRNEDVLGSNERIKVKIGDLLTSLPILFTTGTFLNSLACTVSNEEEKSKTNFPKPWVKSKIKDLGICDKFKFEKGYISSLSSSLTLIIYQIISDSFIPEIICIEFITIRYRLKEEMLDLNLIFNKDFIYKPEENKKKEQFADTKAQICQLFGIKDFLQNRITILNYLIDYYNRNTNGNYSNNNISDNSGILKLKDITVNHQEKKEKEEQHEDHEEEMEENELMLYEENLKKYVNKVNGKVHSNILKRYLYSNQVESKSQKKKKQRVGSIKAYEGNTIISKTVQIESDETDNSEYSSISSDESYIHADFNATTRNEEPGSPDHDSLTYKERLKKYGSGYEEWRGYAVLFYRDLIDTDSGHEIMGGSRWLWENREDFGWSEKDYNYYND